MYQGLAKLLHYVHLLGNPPKITCYLSDSTAKPTR